MTASIIFIAIITIIWLIRSNLSDKRIDPFRYIWDIDILKAKYKEKKNKSSLELEKLNHFYFTALQRIEKILPYIRKCLPDILHEAEHTLGRKRSLERLKEKSWEYIEKLANLAGYNTKEVDISEFYCPGWNKVWDIYRKNKERILHKTSSFQRKDNKAYSSFEKTFLKQKKIFFREALHKLKSASNRTQLKKSYQNSVRFFQKYGTKHGWEFSGSIEDSALKALFEALWNSFPGDENTTSYEYNFTGEAKNQSEHEENSHTSQESIRERNSKIFEGIWDIKELKRKYRRLAKLNHPDHGGNHKAMKLLNAYYYEALKRIQENESARF